MISLHRSRGAAASLLRLLSYFILISLVLSAALLAAPEQAARAQSADPGLRWTLTVRVPPPPGGKLSAPDAGAARRELETVLAARLADPGVQARVEADASGLVARFSGSGGLEQFRQTVFTDLRGQVNFPGEGLEIVLTAPAARGQQVALTLDSNITTGYGWEWDELDPAQFTLLDEPAPLPLPGPFRLGAPQRITAVLVAAADGDLSARLVYRRPWLADAPQSRLELQADELPAALDLSGPGPQAGLSLPMSPAGPQPEVPIEPQALPASFDWRTTGKVSAVRDQGNCGSCWAFGIVGVLEAAIKVQLNGPERDLSEQFLINCNTYGDNCGGGWWSSHDFHYNKVKSPQTEPGAVAESLVPYKALNGSCAANYAKSYQLARWQYINYDTPNVDAIKQAILSYGPVGTAVCVGPKFSGYSGGVFATNEDCGTAVVNHAVILVGWDDSTQSWIMKNSWDTWWGEDGYMRIKYGTSQIGYWANYVVVQSSPPALISPAAGAVTADLNPQYSWEAAADALDYQFQVSLSNAFSSTLVNVTVTDPAYTQEAPLAPNSLYYWRVRARFAAGPSNWSAPRALKTLPSVPAPAAPMNGESVRVLRPPLAWTQAGSASKYELQVSRQPDFSALTATGSSTGLSWTPGADLPRNAGLFWRVRAVGAYGASAWSSPGASFTTLDPPLPPVLASPAAGAVVRADSRPNFSWKPPAVSLPEGYLIQFSRASTFAEITGEADVTGTAYPYPQALAPNSLLYWRVASYNGSPRMTSAYSAARAVKILPAVPALMNPVGAPATSLRPTLNWEAGANRPAYDLQVSKLSTCASPFKSATVSQPAFTFTSDLARTTTYYWRVRARGAYGVSAWSACQTFTTPNPPSVPVVTFPSTGFILPESANFQPTFKWKVSTNRPDGYVIQVSKGSTFNAAAALEVTVNDPAQTSLTWPEALPYGTYAWRMRSFRAGPEYSNWTAARTFRTPAGLQGRVTDAAAGQPLEGVKITVSGTSLAAFTDRNGAYSLPVVPTGARTVYFTKENYVRGSKAVTFTAGSLRVLDAAASPVVP